MTVVTTGFVDTDISGSVNSNEKWMAIIPCLKQMLINDLLIDQY